MGSYLQLARCQSSIPFSGSFPTGFSGCVQRFNQVWAPTHLVSQIFYHTKNWFAMRINQWPLHGNTSCSLLLLTATPSSWSSDGHIERPQHLDLALHNMAFEARVQCQVRCPVETILALSLKSLICLVGKSMAPHRGNTILFSLYFLRPKPPQGFWADTAPFKSPQPYLVHCFWNYRDIRLPTSVSS